MLFFHSIVFPVSQLLPLSVFVTSQALSTVSASLRCTILA